MGITYRAFQKTDIPRVVEIANIIESQRNDPGRTTEEGLQHIVAAPHIHAEEDFFVALDANHQVIGASFMMLRGDNGMFLGEILVHPDYWKQAVTADLIERTNTRSLQRANTELPDIPAVHLNFIVPEYRTYLIDALKADDYSEVRRQYVMRMALDTALSPIQLPEGYEFGAFDIERDAKQVHAAFQASFADHWGDVSQMPYDQWAQQFENPHFDPTLWYILYHNNEIAAICLCETTTREASLGIVEVLGVLPSHRKRGLGGFLLRHAFYQFQQRDFQNVELGVDSQNTTNAVALYQNAGMSIHKCNIIFRKVLRGDPTAIEA